MPTETQNTSYPAFDYSLPPAPSYNPTQYSAGLGYTPSGLSNNSYSPGSPQYNVFEAYKGYLGRAPENEQVINQWAADPNYQTGIAGSPEAKTYGRARNEVDPIIDSQLRGLYDQMGIEQQRTSSQLQALRPQYESEFNNLLFGRDQGYNDLNYLRDKVMQDTDYNASQLQGRFMPAQQNAFATANRRGLLDSSVALGLLNQGFEPIQRGLTDLYRSSQQQLTDAERKRQSLSEKYNLDYQNLSSKREQEARSLRDQLALLMAQKQSEGNQLNQQRTAKVNARAGELGDLGFQQNLQQQSLAEQIREFNANLALQQQAANKI